MIYASFGQNRLGSFDNGEAQYDMILRFDDEYRKDAQALQKLKIKNARGESISLSAVAEFKTSKTFSVINRFKSAAACPEKCPERRTGPVRRAWRRPAAGSAET